MFDGPLSSKRPQVASGSTRPALSSTLPGVEAEMTAVRLLARATGRHVVALGALHGAAACGPDQTSSKWCLAATRETLSAAIQRYDAISGSNELELARQTIETSYGYQAAISALGPLMAAASVRTWLMAMALSDDTSKLASVRLEVEIDNLLTPQPLAGPVYERRRSSGGPGWVFDTGLSCLAEPLAALLGIHKTSAVPQQDPAVALAVTQLECAIAEALTQGATMELLQKVFNAWTVATDGPKIVIIDVENSAGKHSA
jgi:hypothetical protein